MNTNLVAAGTWHDEKKKPAFVSRLFHVKIRYVVVKQADGQADMNA